MFISVFHEFHLVSPKWLQLFRIKYTISRSSFSGTSTPLFSGLLEEPTGGEDVYKKFVFLFPHIRYCIYLSIYLSICLSIHLSMYQSINLSICLSIYLSMYTYIHTYIHTYIQTYIHTYIYIYIFIYFFYLS